MSRDKAVYESQQIDKNGAKRESTRTVKSREPSRDRNNVPERKGLKRTESVTRDVKNKIVKDNSTLKINNSTTKNNETKRKEISNKKIISKTSRTSVIPSTSKTKPSDSTRSTPKSDISKQTSNTLLKSKINNGKEIINSRLNSKSDTIIRSSSNVSSTAIKSKSNVALNSMKSTSRDTVSNRVTKEKYFPKKFPFSTHLHEGEDKRDSKTDEDTEIITDDLQTIDNSPRIIDNELKLIKNRKEIDEERRKRINDLRIKEKNPQPKEHGAKKDEDRPKLTRERTMTRILSPDEVKVVKQLVISKKKGNKENAERPLTATIRKGKIEHHNDASNDTSLSDMTDSSLQISIASTVRRNKTPDTATKSRTNSSLASSVHKSDKTKYATPDSSERRSSLVASPKKEISLKNQNPESSERNNFVASPKRNIKTKNETPDSSARISEISNSSMASKVHKNIIKPKIETPDSSVRLSESSNSSIISNIRKKNIKVKNETPDSSARSSEKTISLSSKSVQQKSNLKDVDDGSKTRLHTSKTVQKKEFEDQPTTSKTSEIYSEADTSEYDYEDDFDSYESDFEEYKSSGSSPSDINTDSITSSDTEDNVELTQKRINSAETDEEKKMDSGTYDLPELKHKQVLDKIKEAIEKENLELSSKNYKKVNDAPSNLASLSDEGFDEKFSLNNGFINFTDTRKKQIKKKINRKQKKRGDNLMNMIRLDAVSYNLFEMKAISYDEFMQSYGRQGTAQVSAQTGEDNISEEVQTDEIIYLNKWTQYPIRSPNNIEQNTLYNHLGVGEDPVIPKPEKEYQPDNTKKLENFIKSAGKLILTLLEKQSLDSYEYIHKNERNIPFSEGYFKLHIDTYPFLSNRPITYMAYSDSSRLLTVHKSNTEVYMNADEQLLSRSTICVWNLLEPIQPKKILVSSGEIIKACFDNKHNYLIFAGINDGAVSVWDLRESSSQHRLVYEDKMDREFVMRCATYTTTAIQDTDNNTYEIVSIQPLYTDTEDNITMVNKKEIISMQLCTLDEFGVIKIWSVIQRQNPTNVITEDQGLVPWGNVVLVQGTIISMQNLNPELKELQCFDLQCSDKDSNHLYVASNYGVLHCLTSGMKPKPRIYLAESDAGRSVSCIEMCPFSSTHFLAGSDNGNIRLHSCFYEKSLINLRSCEEDGSSEERIEIIQWSNSRPCVFYVKDSSNYIHVWDLLSSDMYPIYSIPFREDITCIKLSPLQTGNNTSYMAISSKRGNVYLHTINNKYGQQSAEQHTLELQTFLNYVKRL